MAKLCTKSVEGSVVRFVFADGRSLAVDANALSDEMREAAMLHGLKQKVGDSFAGAKSIDEAWSAADMTIGNLRAGSWNTKAQTGGDIIFAIMEVKGLEEHIAREAWSNMDDVQRKLVRKHPKVDAVLKRLALERAERAVVVSNGADDDFDALDALLPQA